MNSKLFSIIMAVTLLVTTTLVGLVVEAAAMTLLVDRGLLGVALISHIIVVCYAVVAILENGRVISKC